MPKLEKAGTIICQRCLAANALEQEFCARCGTRLMLVVETSALRYEDETDVADYDEHLLERISALESRLQRIAEKVERSLDFLAGSARTAYFDHILLETLVGVLGESRIITSGQIESRWRERIEREAAELAENSRRMELLAQAPANLVGAEREAFRSLIQEGLALFDAGRASQGVRRLERAAALAPASAALNSFIGEHFFRAGRMTLAHEYLARAHAAEPGNRKLCLLLGLVCGEEGDAPRAKELLRQSLRGGELSFSAHYALGRLHAAESDWKSALVEFKAALSARDCPEGRYVLSLAYFQLGRYRTALRHLSKALEMDREYGEALYLRGIVLLRLGERVRASASFKAARAVTGVAPSAGTPLKGAARLDDLPAPTLFKATRRGRTRLLTGGDNRIAAAMREDALGNNAPR